MKRQLANVVTASAGRVGLVPIQRVFLVENHDQAYSIWRDAGVEQRILVHIDSHHDLWWIDKPSLLSIANYICPALQERMVREVFWVVPDATWATEANRRHVLRHAREILRRWPGACRLLPTNEREIPVDLDGRLLRIGTLDALPRFTEPVLLDVDVDFFLIPRVTYGESDCYGPLPWCWPTQLIERLEAAGLQTDLATIAYSVEGGYTSLEWKWLGDELDLLLQGPTASDAARQAMAHMREGAESSARGEFAAAERQYARARDLLPGAAAPHFHLARAYLALGNREQARKWYQQALERDASYRTPYKSAGLRLHAEKRYREAEEEHRRTLELDPHDAWAHLGLGALAARRKQWSEAEGLLRRAVELDKELVDGWRELAAVLDRLGHTGEAIEAYEISLRLSLEGRKPLKAPIATYPPSNAFADPEHCRIYGQLGRLYQSRGAREEAIKRYRISVAGTGAGPTTRLRLAWLLLRQGQGFGASRQAWQALLEFPSTALRAGRRLARRASQLPKMT